MSEVVQEEESSGAVVEKSVGDAASVPGVVGQALPLAGLALPDSIELAITSGAAAKAGVGLGRKFLVTRMGIRFLGKMTIEQWRDLLAGWKWMGQDLYHVGLADIIEYGNEAFGESVVDETLEFYGFDMADALKAHAIGQIPLDLRVVELTSEHYYHLGRMLPGAKKEQGKWAAIAQKEGLTPVELKKSIEQGKVVRLKTIERESGRDTGIANIEGLSLTFQRWEKQAGGEEEILKQSMDWKVKFLRELHPILEVARKVSSTLPDEVRAKVETGEPLVEEPSEQEKVEANEERLGAENFVANEAVGQALPLAEEDAVSVQGEEVAP